jgi:hypothetical protein
VTAKVDAYYGFAIRRLAARGELPAGFHAAIPASPRISASPLATSSAAGELELGLNAEEREEASETEPV